MQEDLAFKEDKNAKEPPIVPLKWMESGYKMNSADAECCGNELLNSVSAVVRDDLPPDLCKRIAKFCKQHNFSESINESEASSAESNSTPNGK